MLDLGHFFLTLSFLLAIYAIIIGFYGAYNKLDRFILSAKNSLIAQGVLTCASLVALGYLFVTDNFAYRYIWQHSNKSMPDIYKISAVWGGMDGSMLLWGSFVSFFSLLSIIKSRKLFYQPSYKNLYSYLIPTYALSNLFFIFVVVFFTNPFRFNPGRLIPEDGNGLNPLLQNPSMLIHPPILYVGFTGLVVPFAFCLAALLSNTLSVDWIQIVRRWTIVSWTFLTCGIILGGNWAYIELGWGGFWAWDPVENASFLPWLSATALLHSAMVQEARGMLKIWNVMLAILTYLLVVFGTFLTRSGIVQSVHAFAKTDFGWVFIVYLVSIIILSLVLVLYRWKELRPENRFENFFSREIVFLFNNLLLLSIAFTVFWGVMFPVFSEALLEKKVNLGPPFFNLVTMPLFCALIFFMGVGPMMSWRKSKVKNLIKVFIKPFFFGSLIALLFFYFDTSRYLSAIAFGLCTFVLCTIEAEFRRAAKVRRDLLKVEGRSENYLTSMSKVINKKPRKFGGLIVHIGVVVAAIAITASSAYKIEKDIVISEGKEESIGNYILKLIKVKEENFKNYVALIANLEVRDATTNKFIGYLNPEKRFYPTNQESTSEVDIRMTLKDDLYLALAGIEEKTPPATSSENVNIILKGFVNPLQMWLWFGGVVMLFGSLVVLKEKSFEI